MRTHSLRRAISAALATTPVALLQAGHALAQVGACAPGPVTVDGSQCTVTPASVITVTAAATPGMRAINVGGAITANGVVVNLGSGSTAAGGFIGVDAANGAVVTLGSNAGVGTTIRSNSTNNSSGQRGLVARGGGQVVSTAAIVDLGRQN